MVWLNFEKNRRFLFCTVQPLLMCIEKSKSLFSSYGVNETEVNIISIFFPIQWYNKQHGAGLMRWPVKSQAHKTKLVKMRESHFLTIFKMLFNVKKFVKYSSQKSEPYTEVVPIVSFFPENFLEFEIQWALQITTLIVLFILENCACLIYNSCSIWL